MYIRLIRLEDMTLLGAPVIGSQAMEVTLKEKKHAYCRTPYADYRN